MARTLTAVGGHVAPTSNIGLAHTVMDALTTRAEGLPGIGAFYGPSGVGKSFGAMYASHPGGFNGVYVSCRSFETRRSFAEQVCKAFSIVPKGNIPRLVDEIIQALALSGRPLVVDEVDHIVESRTLEVIRDLHDASGAAVLLIGEEHLPGKLRRHERFDNRVLVWQPAVRCTAADFDLLAKQYAGAISIDAGLKARVLSETAGITRRVVVNLENIKRWCDRHGVKVASEGADLELYTGKAPGRWAVA
ncbi:AAA family ATPase [Xenophilus aerolatus]|nr:ATP-binding protein [Xenophilus aerolatus]